MNQLSQKTGTYKSKARLSILFSTAVLATVIYLADLQNILEILKQANLSLILLALVTSNITIFIYAYTWKEVFSISGIKINYINSLRIVLANVFVNNVTPFGNIGGEAAVTYLISKTSEYKTGKIFSSIFTASLINFAPLGSLLVLGLIFAVRLDIILLLMVISSSALIFGKYFFDKNILPDIFHSKVPEKVKSFLEEFLKASKTLLDYKPRLLVLLGATHFAIFFDVISIVIIAEAFGGDLFSPLVLIIIPVSRVANYFPTPGGSGSYEAMMIGLLTFYMNLSPSVAVSTVVTYRVLTYYVGLIFGYLALNSIGLDEGFLEKHDETTKE